MSIKYIITTTPIYTQPLNHLLDSMYVAGISPDNVVLSCQNTYSNVEYYSYSIFDKLYKININQSIYEYTFFVTCMKLLNMGLASAKDQFFLIHDTCTLLQCHKDKISSILSLIEKYDIIMGDVVGRYNMGIYNIKSIEIGYDAWKNIDYISKQQAIDIEHSRFDDNNDNQKLSIKKNTSLKVYFPGLTSQIYHDIEVYSPKPLRYTGTLDFFGIHKYFFYVDPDNNHPNHP